MATKLLNIRMDEEMLKDLKEVCGELGINVTDAIKSFSKELIENKKLPVKKEKKVKRDENGIKIIDDPEDIREMISDFDDIGGKENIEKFEKMNEDISNIIWSYYKKLRTFIEKLDKFTLIHYSYSEISEKFKKENPEFLDEKITDIMLEFCKIEYEQNLSHLKEEQKFEDSKYASIMKTIEKENPELYNKIFEEYGYNIKNEDIWYLKCKNYDEAKKKLEELLTPEEIKLFIDYNRGTDGYETNGFSLEFMEQIQKREEEEGIYLKDIYEKLNSTIEYVPYDEQEDLEENLKTNN